MKISGIFLCVIATAGVVFFGSDQEYILDFGTHLFFVSLFLYIPGIYLLYKHYKRKNAGRLRILRKPVQQFKKQARREKVDLMKCRIVPGGDESLNGCKRSMDYHLNFHDTLYSKEFLTNELTDVDFHLVYEDDNRRFVSSPIPLEEAEISEELRVKRETCIYVDAADAERYYFDIEFLEV